MQEFSSISVSTYSPDDLTGQLNERAREGWSVVAIVPTGSTVTAYLSRSADDADVSATTGEPAVTESAATEPAEPAAATPTSSESEHFEVAGVAAAPEPATSEPAAPAPTPEPAAPEPAPEPATAAAPAGWYADPSSRFELRYWDGSTWTEHVSRGGQQFTDPPVA